MCARGSVVQACGDCECVLEGVWCRCVETECVLEGVWCRCVETVNVC